MPVSGCWRTWPSAPAWAPIFRVVFASKLKRPRRHAPGEVLVDLAVTLADGGECVSDLKVLRD
jgi:hypothetical protein